MPAPQHLYLLRHAKAEPWFPGVDDFARPLSDRGREHMRRLAAWAAESLAAPALVLCSPSARTRGTLEALQTAWDGQEVVTRFEPAIYEATARRLQDLADAGFAEADRVLMVGHNPGFEYFAWSALGDREAARIGKMATGSLAVIEFPDGWPQNQGILRHWVRRKDLPAH